MNHPQTGTYGSKNKKVIPSVPVFKNRNSKYLNSILLILSPMYYKGGIVHEPATTFTGPESHIKGAGGGQAGNGSGVSGSEGTIVEVRATRAGPQAEEMFHILAGMGSGKGDR